MKDGISKQDERKQRDKVILSYAQNYHNPISDFKGFNALLKNDCGFRTTKKKVARLLNII